MRGDLVLVRPIITEKSMTGTNSGRYTFAGIPSLSRLKSTIR